MTSARRRRTRSESGAVAVIFAISTVMIFGFAALSVDLGNAWARKRSSQTQADLAALAGGQLLPKGDSANQQAIAQEVASYLNENKISDDQPTVTAAQLLSATHDPDTGWIDFPNDNQLHVVAPESRVEFGVAAAIGKSGTLISTEATVEKRALDPTPDRVLPMWLPASCVYGPVEGDTDPITGSPAASPTYDPFGDDGFTEDVKLSITSITPNTAEYGSSVSSIEVKIRNDDGNPVGTPTTPVKGGIVFTHGEPQTWDTVYPVMLDIPGKTGATPGEQTVTISGVSTEVTDFVGSWEVWVVKNLPSSDVPDPATVFSKNPATFTVTGGGGEVACDDNQRGNFGQLDSPRSGVNQLQDRLGYNIALGLDHKLDRFDPSLALPVDLSADPECGIVDGVPTGALIDNQVRNGNNCIYVQGGNDPSALTAGLLTGVSGAAGSKPGRLFSAPTSQRCTDNGRTAPPKANDAHVSWSSINRDTLSCFLKDGVDLDDIAKDGADIDLLDESIKQSPRFFHVPVVYSQEREDKKYLAIKQFAPVFLTDETIAACASSKPCASANNGIQMNTGGSQIFAVQLFAFNDNTIPVDPNGDDSEWFPGGRAVVRLID